MSLYIVGSRTVQQYFELWFVCYLHLCGLWLVRSDCVISYFGSRELAIKIM